MWGKRFQGFYPVKRKGTEDSYWAIKHFQGTSKWDLLYTDKARQFRKSAAWLGVPWDCAPPGDPASNAFAEAHVGSVCGAIRACSITAGLPACFWPFIGACIVMLRNIWKHQDGVSAWTERFGEEFDGRAITPGALVWFRPSTVKVRIGKMYGRLQPGIFLGYELGQGCRWRGVYYVADLESFRGIHLNQATPAKYFTHCVHATKVVRIPDSDSLIFLPKINMISTMDTLTLQV